MNSMVIPLAGKVYKVFLVEEDDDDRERVMYGKATTAEFQVSPDYSELTLNLVPNEEGIFFTLENFSETPVEVEESDYEELDWE